MLLNLLNSRLLGFGCYEHSQCIGKFQCRSAFQEMCSPRYFVGICFAKRRMSNFGLLGFDLPGAQSLEVCSQISSSPVGLYSCYCGMKLKVAWRNIVHYVRNDLREIAFPSSLPDPPSSKPKPRKLTLWEHLYVWKTGTRLYIRSWKTGTFDDEEEEVIEDTKETDHQKSPEDRTIMEELALAARAGSEHLRPALQRVYMTRASAYRDALRNFVQGYQEGIAEVSKKASAERSEHQVETQTADFHNAESTDSPKGEKEKMTTPGL